MRRRTALFFAPILLGLVACGGEDGPDAEAEERDARQAMAAFEEVLTGDGFEPDPEAGDEDDGELEFTSEECRALDEFLSDEEEEVDGQTVERESEGFVRSSDTAQESVEGSLTFADGDALLDELEIPDDDQAADCLEEAMKTTLEEDPEAEFEVGEITAELERPDLGDGALRFVISSELTVEGATLPFVIDVLSVVEGRRGASVVTSTVGDDPTIDLEELVQVLLTGEGPA